jgi:hypothetical protein
MVHFDCDEKTAEIPIARSAFLRKAEQNMPKVSSRRANPRPPFRMSPTTSRDRSLAFPSCRINPVKLRNSFRYRSVKSRPCRVSCVSTRPTIRRPNHQTVREMSGMTRECTHGQLGHGLLPGLSPGLGQGQELRSSRMSVQRPLALGLAVLGQVLQLANFYT